MKFQPITVLVKIQNSVEKRTQRAEHRVFYLSRELFNLTSQEQVKNWPQHWKTLEVAL